jgi:oxygen-independent coproporphyrinogen-3 oxidase
MDRNELLSRYGTAAVPRYTSYPSANVWPDQDEAFAKAALASATRPLSLYVHVPFCRKLCFYCGCNMMVTNDDALVARYLDALDVEIERTAALLPSQQRAAVQLHLGGGTPTFLSAAQLARVTSSLRRAFAFASDIEAGIEVHPAVTSFEQIDALAQLGFNRISMGVQDFDPRVQERVNRIQPFEETRDLVERARSAGFVSVNVDLMYGLPLQTTERFADTVDKVLALSPDRIALFGYAHMPKLKKHQSLIQVDELPGPSLRLALLSQTIERLVGAGYDYVGLDHFAKRDDELCRARRAGTLRRNFMGYTTCAESDVIAFGPSAISEMRGAFLQNDRDVRDWARRLEQGALPVVRGYALSDDDQRRRDVIMQLFCRLDVDTDAFARAYGAGFDDAFHEELARLVPLERDGLVRREEGHVRVTYEGQLFLRNVAAVFDAFLPKVAAAGAATQHSTAV